MYNLQEAGTEKVSTFCKDHTMRLESKKNKLFFCFCCDKILDDLFIFYHPQVLNEYNV